LSLIEINVEGIDTLTMKFENLLSQHYLQRTVYDAMFEVATEMYQFLISEVSMTQIYRDAFVIAENPYQNEIIIGVVLSDDQLANKDKDSASWRLYRCPKRRYVGGQLIKVPTEEIKALSQGASGGNETLKNFWDTYGTSYSNKFRQKIIEAVSLSIG
jgi:hypothetical protein